MTPLEAIGLLYVREITGEGLDLIEMQEVRDVLPFITADDATSALAEVAEWLTHGDVRDL